MNNNSNAAIKILLLKKCIKNKKISLNFPLQLQPKYK